MVSAVLGRGQPLRPRARRRRRGPGRGGGCSTPCGVIDVQGNGFDLHRGTCSPAARRSSCPPITAVAFGGGQDTHPQPGTRSPDPAHRYLGDSELARHRRRRRAITHIDPPEAIVGLPLSGCRTHHAPGDRLRRRRTGRRSGPGSARDTRPQPHHDRLQSAGDRSEAGQPAAAGVSARRVPRDYHAPGGARQQSAGVLRDELQAAHCSALMSCPTTSPTAHAAITPPRLLWRDGPARRAGDWLGGADWRARSTVRQAGGASGLAYGTSACVDHGLHPEASPARQP